MGTLISIDGLDGSGKGTQSRLLYDYLTSKGVKARLISFPTYDDISCAAVKLYLDGKLGKNPSDTNAYAASTFFAVDRYISFKNDWENDYNNGSIIIADRYTTANAVHQLSKLPRKDWDGFLSWLWDYEFTKLGLPAPDKVIYLKMHPDVSISLINHRAETEGLKKDIHEANKDFLYNSYEAAKYASDKLGWISLDCTENGKLLSIECIHEKIKNLLNI